MDERMSARESEGMGKFVVVKWEGREGKSERMKKITEKVKRVKEREERSEDQKRLTS